MSLVMGVLRSADLLNLELEFINLKIQDIGPRLALTREAAGAAFIVLRLPAQHMAEQVIVRGGGLTSPFKAIISGPSRLAFRVPDDRSEVTLSLTDILDLIRTVPPEVPSNPLGVSAATVIEFPDRLLLVPEVREENALRLHHRNDAPDLEATNWAELWQTRLQNLRGELRFQPLSHPKEAATDLEDEQRLSPATLARQDRLDIVKRSTIEPSGPHVVVAEQFLLSALGASVKLRSAWTSPADSTTLSAWSHNSSHGRDCFVRTVREGFLLPFGHRAAIETINTREVSFGGIAALKQLSVIALRELEKTYQGRDMPLKRVQLTSIPSLIDDGTGNAQIGPYSVDATVVDVAGNSINCVLKTLFVPMHKALDSNALKPIIDKYLDHSGHDPELWLNRVDLRLQRMLLAEDRENRGGTDFRVSSMMFDVTPPDTGVPGSAGPAFRPVMASAEVSIPAVEQMKGAVRNTRIRANRALTAIKLTKHYVDVGFEQDDAKQVFAEIIEPIDGLSIPADKAGGLASPKFPAMDGLSKLMGPVSDVRNFAGADVPPVDAKALIGDTKLLGTIILKDIVDLSQSSDLSFLTQRPEDLFVEVEKSDFFLRRPVISTARNGQVVETRFVWKPKISGELPGGVLKHRGGSSEKMQLLIKGRVKLAPKADEADLKVEGRLTNFVLSLAQLVDVEFNHIEFISNAGRKMEVKTSIANIVFLGALAFAEEIRKAIPIGALGDASVSPQPDGIVVRYGLGLPAIGLGVLTLQNIAFNSSVSLPFVEKPVGVRFSLSERSNPFVVSVAPFGGTGFFALEMRTSGPNAVLVEAAIEFGGIIAFNLLGIVKGGVYVLAGVYLAIRSDAPPEISAHLRIGGFVDVLGLISVSIELYLALEFRDNKLSGTAQLTIGVKVLFFSKTFSFRVHKEIAHLGGPPSDRRADFRILMDQSQWETYCRAFA